MNENILPISNLNSLLEYNTRQFFSAEIQLERSLHEWINKASSLQLKTILQKYHEFVRQHVEKIGVFMEEQKINSFGLTDKVMMALIEDAERKMSLCKDSEVLDASLLASVQAINHLKICLYGTAAAFAKSLEMQGPAEIFHTAEVNEKQIDDRLSQLAEFEINKKARAPIVLPG